MGYTTDFSGDIIMSRRLTPEEAAIIQEFVEAEHNDHPIGMYEKYTDWRMERSTEGDFFLFITESSNGDKQPQWLQYMIEKFFAPWGVVLNGSLSASGSDAGGDFWTIDVTDNVVTETSQEIVDSPLLQSLLSSKQSIIQRLKSIEEKINGNLIGAWDGALSATSSAVALEDFDDNEAEDQDDEDYDPSKVTKYNGWHDDLKQLITELESN